MSRPVLDYRAAPKPAFTARGIVRIMVVIIAAAIAIGAVVVWAYYRSIRPNV